MKRCIDRRSGSQAGQIGFDLQLPASGVDQRLEARFRDHAAAGLQGNDLSGNLVVEQRHLTVVVENATDQVDGSAAVVIQTFAGGDADRVVVQAAVEDRDGVFRCRSAPRIRRAASQVECRERSPDGPRRYT